MKWDYERIIFDSEWNHFCFRKGPIKQKPGERKRKRDKGRKQEKERKGEGKKMQGREKTEANRYPSNVGNCLFKKCCYLFTKSCPTLLQPYEL